MVPGPSALPVICAQQAQSTETRLEQVLSCALVDSPEQLTQGQDRASYAWEGLRTHMGGGMERLKERPGDGTITAWPYGQVMTAALNRAKLSGDYSDFDQLLQGLDKYQRSDGGYSPKPNRFGFEGNQFMDDNAWIGLAFVQAAQQRPDSDYLKKAESVARMLQANQSADGGLIWEEGNGSQDGSRGADEMVLQPGHPGGRSSAVA